MFRYLGIRIENPGPSKPGMALALDEWDSKEVSHEEDFFRSRPRFGFDEL